MNDFVAAVDKEETLRHKLLPLSANPDFNNFGTPLNTPYYDLAAHMNKGVELYGTDALDQAIENLICTEPMERLFNVNFWSPLYKILFENGADVNSLASSVYDQIENYVPVKIDRSSATINYVSYTHELEISIPYLYDFHGETRAHIFKRIIGR